MNSEEMRINDIFGRENHFQVPEGYFDSLADQIMAKLPKTEEASPSIEVALPGHAAKEIPLRQPSSLWQRLPLRKVAAAACIAALVGSGTLYALQRSQSQHQAQQAQAHVAATVSSSYSEDTDIDQMADYAMMDSQDFYAQLVAEN